VKSIIKYFGGKNGFANKILEHFPTNYQNLNYIEPFAGSAALLFHKQSSPIEVINDLDSNLIALYNTIINPDSFEQFKRVLDLTPYSEELHYTWLKDLKGELTQLERAYKYFYVNRTAYNGLGGFSISSVIRRGMSKPVSDYLSAIDGLPQVHNRLSKVIVTSRDGIELIKKWDVDNTFIYSDSPYANETRSAGRYKFDFTDEMQDKYLDVLVSLKSAKILVSGYACDRYKRLEDAGYTRIDMEIKTQNTNRKGKSKIESLWKNY
jgi:DNA adenine methylase